VNHRSTSRKRIIQEVLDKQLGKPMLLDELRWLVFLRESRDERRSADLTPSYKKSFCRTLRDHMPLLGVYKLWRPDRSPAGIVARCAVYRCSSAKTLKAILGGETISVFIDLKNSRAMESNPENHAYIVDSGAFMMDRRKMLYCWVCVGQVNDYDSQAIHRACIPVNHPLSIVGSSVSTNDIQAIASHGWTSYRVSAMRVGFFRKVNNQALIDIPDYYRDLARDDNKRLEVVIQEQLAGRITR
jgi:hypothetical protein